MTNAEQILTIIAAATPSIVTLIASIILSIINKVTVKSVSKKIDEINTEMKNSKELAELKAQLTIVHQENFVLKKRLNELLTKLDKVVRGADDDKANQNM